RTITQFADRPNNVGLEATPADTGAGQGRFKPASLRNVAVRPPDMHDRRFSRLGQGGEVFSTKVQNGPFLDPRLRAGDSTPRRWHFTPEQQNALVAFLKALTDSTFLGAAKFASPFACY